MFDRRAMAGRQRAMAGRQRVNDTVFLFELILEIIIMIIIKLLKNNYFIFPGYIFLIFLLLSISINSRLFFPV